MTPDLDPDLDLRIGRVIRALRHGVRGLDRPVRLARWWLPAPMPCRVESLEVASGGAFVTSMSDGGASFVPHLDACFLIAEAGERIVFTNALDSRWRPADPTPISMTAEITFGEHPEGTDYRVVVRHADASSRARHEELGFADGWGTVTAQLAAIAEAPEEDR